MRITFSTAALWLLARLPLRANHRLGSTLGWAGYVFPTRWRRVSRINIDLCFPALSTRERRRLIRESLIETGKMLTETAALLLWDGRRVLDLVKKVTGEDAVHDAMKQGQGVILATPHLGAWELAGLYCSSRWPLTTLYRPLRAGTLDAMIRAGRERLGAHLVPTDASGVRALYQALGRGAAVGILPDQNPGRGTGVFAPFFGVAANTMVLLPRLARKTGAPLIYVVAERLPRGRGYHIHFYPAGNEISAAEIETAARRLNQDLETRIRERPEQYWWSYKRFRTRPEGEPGIY